MSANRPAQFLIVILCVLLLPGCVPKKATDEVDFGTVEKSVYRNKYFGFSLTLPSEWSVQDQEAKQRLSEMGGKLMAGEDRRMKNIVKASEHRTINLLTAFKHPLGTPVRFNPSVICLAERVGNFSGIKSGKDYHAHGRKLMESSQMPITFAQDLTVEKLGGIDFDVMHGSIAAGGLTVQQKYYAAVMKDYALVFITSFNVPEQQSALQNILGTVAFK